MNWRTGIPEVVAIRTLVPADAAEYDLAAETGGVLVEVAAAAAAAGRDDDGEWAQ